MTEPRPPIIMMYSRGAPRRGKEVRDANQLRHLVAGIAPNTKVRLDVFREKKTIQLEVTIGLRDLDQLSRRTIPESVPGRANRPVD